MNDIKHDMKNWFPQESAGVVAVEYSPKPCFSKIPLPFPTIGGMFRKRKKIWKMNEDRCLDCPPTFNQQTCKYSSHLN